MKKILVILVSFLIISIVLTAFIIYSFVKLNIKDGKPGDFLLTIKFKKDILSINDTDFNLRMELKNIRNYPIYSSNKFEHGSGIFLYIHTNGSTFFKGDLNTYGFIGSEIKLNPNDKMFFNYDVLGKRFVNTKFIEPMYLYFPQIGDFEIFVHFEHLAKSNIYKVTIT